MILLNLMQKPLSPEARRLRKNRGMRATRAKWSPERKEKEAAAVRAWRPNPEQLERRREAAREWARKKRLEDPEGVRRRTRDWFRANPEKSREYAAKPGARLRIWERHLARRYGLAVEDFARLMHAQDRRCAGCRDDLVEGKGLHIDHCHRTGSVRGLLCQSCNHALGMVRENVETMRRLALYLERQQ